MSENKTKRTVLGKVVSNKMQKTAVVQVERLERHPLYEKSMRMLKKFLAHDENNECKVGDTVKIAETKPISGKKTWILVEILERAK